MKLVCELPLHLSNITLSYRRILRINVDLAGPDVFAGPSQVSSFFQSMFHHQYIDYGFTHLLMFCIGVCIIKVAESFCESSLHESIQVFM